MLSVIKNQIEIIIYLFLIQVSTLHAQNYSDSIKIKTGGTYIFTQNNNETCTATVISQDENDMYVYAKKQGIILIHKKTLTKIEAVDAKAMRNTRALPGRNEVSLGYGFVGSGNKNKKFHYRESIFTLGYRHNCTKSIAIGFNIGLDKQNGDASFYNGLYYSYTNIITKFSFAPEVTFNYFEKTDLEKNLYIKLYGSISFGLLYKLDENDTVVMHQPGSIFFASSKVNDNSNYTYQISPLGLRLGRSLAGYIELGYGYKGIVNIGVDLRSRNHSKTNELKKP